ncbi:ESPR domain-containing protein [Escherichia coli]|nr:ESPR domain-containing protein [Escherichia coli]
MNKIFKVIWNPATGNYTVTSETAKSRGKKSGRSKLLISALVAGGMLSSFGALANAGNDNGQGVDYGSGSAGDGWVAIGVLIHLKYEKNREDIGLFGIWRD